MALREIYAGVGGGVVACRTSDALAGCSCETVALLCVSENDIEV